MLKHALMDPYFLIKTVHIISSTILFGTGLGTAFFMLSSHFAQNMQEKFYAARTTVLADTLFTAPAVILQPLTGFWLIWNGGHDWTFSWLMWTYGIYILAYPRFWRSQIPGPLWRSCCLSGLPARYAGKRWGFSFVKNPGIRFCLTGYFMLQ